METFKFVSITALLFLATSSAASKSDTLSLKVPEECKDKGFCSIKPEGYDEMEDVINSLLPPHLTALNVADRDGDATGGTELSPESDWHNCPYRKTTEQQYLYIDKSKSKVDIIIQTAMFKQLIEIVNCAYDKITNVLDDSQQCFQHLSLGSFSMTSKCEASMVTRKLLVFDPELQKIQPKNYEVPCCCSCKITKSI